jgi:hypothetical protein
LGAWFGFGRGVGVQSDPDQEKQVLKQQSELMQQELDAVKKRLEEIEGPAK